MDPTPVMHSLIHLGHRARCQAGNDVVVHMAQLILAAGGMRRDAAAEALEPVAPTPGGPAPAKPGVQPAPSPKK